MWSEIAEGSQIVNSGHPGDRASHGWNSSAAAVLAYDVPHRAPWDWRVSLYTWTKGIAAGGYLVPLLLLLTGVVSIASPIWMWAAPMVGGAFLALTGLLLIADLEHPTRFAKLFLRPQWRSWLVRGAVFISGFTIILVLHFVSNAAKLLGAGNAPGVAGAPEVLAWLGAPFALATAVYTAYLFAQAKARDLWQSSLLPAHLAVQAALAGSAVTMLVASFVEPAAVPTLSLWLAAATGAHLALVWGEVTLAHPTAHAHLAVHEMTRGRHAGSFWFGLVLVAAALAAPIAGSVGAPLLAAAALVGLLAHEHAYVQAGQSVPLA
jgi:formate-dependent nitrite reductase membrane component NrfD